MDGHFETLVYTDCRPGEGLRGSAGLQFQARSSDAVAAAETLVKDHLLYEPPARWMADRRPVEQYPRSFGHLSASGYLATAAGRYLGREANGVREGNQLTHAIVTTDPESYRGLRPAQLFGAGFWSSAPAATTRSDPVSVGPAAGIRTPADAKAFVLDQPNGPGMLLALVAALEKAGRPGAGRVLLVGDDVERIVAWLVAGTLLLPQSRALELGFKIYSNDPARSSAPVVAVHPDFAGAAARLGNQLGYLVFDLPEHRHSDVGVSETARRWVELFLAHDPRDVVDALDVAAESGIQDEEAATALGLAAIMHEEPAARHAETIVGWLRRGPRRLRDAYAADLADLFADMPERWSRRVLQLLDEVACDGLLPGKAADVRVALLLKDVEEAIGGGTVTADRPAALPADEWGPDRDADAHELLAEAIRAPDLPGRAVEALLRVARRYGVGLHPVALGAAAAELARYLADTPDLMEPDNWPHGAEVEELLLTELRNRVLRGGDAPALVGDAWGDWLLARRPALRPELCAAALGAAVRHSADRTALVRAELSEVSEDRSAFTRRTIDLFSQSGVKAAEIRLILEFAPEGTHPFATLFRGLSEIVAGDGPVSAEQLSLCRRLVERGLLKPDRSLRNTLERDTGLTGTLTGLRTEPAADLIRDLLDELARTPGRLIAPRLADVVASLLGVRAFRPLERVFDNHPELLKPYLRGLVEALTKRAQPALAATAFQLISGRLHENAAYRRVVGKALDQWLMRERPDRIEEMTAQLSAVLGAQWTDALQKYVDSIAGRRRIYQMTHLFRSR
ncbi:hypothetical protein J2S43_001641 [Catenuloplanes nepalensis]|uniref:Uncharacterized protein n=1 Tax=Catenuloplanes nepalensis TaxID=587533 RepID=A0ABT9MP16_9ACTN|nr:GTPase-associated protein 1-related protein [Catenuloplanes nepalensis]MDP9793129.1 hypothetical protein [Catenuloplanes nepalensis]